MGCEEIRVADENPGRSWGYFMKARGGGGEKKAKQEDKVGNHKDKNI
jgi:hypothetical protein